MGRHRNMGAHSLPVHPSPEADPPRRGRRRAAVGWPRRTTTSSAWLSRGRSGPTSTTASPSSRCSSRRCAIAPRRSARSPSTSSRTSRRSCTACLPGWRTPRGRRSRPTPGPGTSASSRTSSSPSGAAAMLGLRHHPAGQDAEVRHGPPLAPVTRPGEAHHPEATMGSRTRTECCAPIARASAGASRARPYPLQLARAPSAAATRSTSASTPPAVTAPPTPAPWTRSGLSR